MALVPYSVVALAESDADGTNGKNIVAGAVVTALDADSNVATMYDDATGANPSTAKTTNAGGQVVIYLEPGDYTLGVNGVNTEISLGKFDGTTQSLINSVRSVRAGDVFETSGFYVKNDGGGDKWRATGVTNALTPSQSPIDLGEAKLTDANGNEFELLHSGEINVLSVGGVPNGLASDAANAAVETLVESGGGIVYYPPVSAVTEYIADKPILVDSQIIHKSVGWQVRVKAQDNLNNDVFKSRNFDTLTGMNKWLVSEGVPHGCGFKDIAIDGNKANNLSGRGVALYVKRLQVKNLCIFDCASDGWYSEAGDIPGQQGIYDLPEGQLEVYTRNNGGDGFKFFGPHDTRIISLVSNENGGRGAYFDREPGVHSGSCDIDFAHIYANQLAGFVMDENLNIRGDLIISENNYSEGIIWDGDNSQIATIQMYGNCRTSGAYQMILSATARANKFGSIQFKDDGNATGGLSVLGDENTVCAGVGFGTSTGLTGLNIASTAKGNSINLTLQDYTTALANAAGSEMNNITLHVSDCDLVFNNAGASFGNTYTIGYDIGATQDVLSGFQPVSNDSENWNVRGKKDGVIGLSRVKKQSGGNVDLNSTAEQTITVSLELIAAPRPEDVKFNLLYEGSNTTWRLGYLVLSSVTATLATFKVKVDTAAGATETAKILVDVSI